MVINSRSAMIPEEIVALLESGNSIHAAARDRKLTPAGARVAAVVVDPDRLHLTGYIPTADAKALLAGARANKRLSFSFVRPTDDHACQIKGTLVGVRRAAPKERALVERKLGDQLRELEMIGIQAEALQGWKMWPCVAVRIRVTDCFNQTPGPGAGARVT